MKPLIPFLAGAIVALGAGWAGFPRVIDRARPQPADFSHKVHTDKAGAQCADCHSFRDDGTFAGAPTLDKCAGCHAAPMGTTAAEQAFVEGYVTPGREPQWLRYARQPENVFFSHVSHMNLGKLKCEKCHGNFGTTDKLPTHYEDPISGYSRQTMSMDACIACHRENKLEHSCMDCHK
jgi:menaquinone reductase, multiheme cytochrome c subunit